jgi:hypothetical protein
MSRLSAISDIYVNATKASVEQCSRKTQALDKIFAPAGFEVMFGLLSVLQQRGLRSGP